MHVLFIHQNFPAQFGYIAPRLVADYGWKCTFVTEKAERSLPNVEKLIYAPNGCASSANHIFTRLFENQIGHAHGVYNALKKRPDIQPDLIVAHTGFGSSLFLPFLYDAPIINFLEYFYRPIGRDLGYRPELPVRELQLLRSPTRNAMLLLDLDNCDQGWTPTHYQREFFPTEYQDKIEVIFDGIDTEVFCRRDNPRRQIGPEAFVPPGPQIVTYVARGFEMMRGFDIFMKAAKRIYEQYPNVVFVVVGADGIHYGADKRYIKEGSFREHVLNSGEYDLSRFIFTGLVPPNTLAHILSISDLHIYLTEPFIASWSMVDAMACGAVVLASDQRCVREYITHGQNGLLCDFFDFEALAKKAIEVLETPQDFRHLCDAAISTVTEKYSLAAVMPRLKTFFELVAAKKRRPSVRAALWVRKGTTPSYGDDDDPDTEITTSVHGPSAAAAHVDASIPAPDPLPDVSHLPPAEGAMALLSEMKSRQTDVAGWIYLVQSFRGTGEYARIGPRHHPNDLFRMLNRLREWKTKLILEIGTGEGGMTFLLSRAATDAARIVVGIMPGMTLAPDRMHFLQAMARGKQKIEILHGQENWSSLQEQIDRVRGASKFDLIFITGLRPSGQVRSNFKHFRNRVRAGGIFAVDGIRPAIEPDESHDGGDRLWKEIRPMYPNYAEYLDGIKGMSGGIGMVKL